MINIKTSFLWQNNVFYACLCAYFTAASKLIGWIVLMQLVWIDAYKMCFEFRYYPCFCGSDRKYIFHFEKENVRESKSKSKSKSKVSSLKFKIVLILIFIPLIKFHSFDFDLISRLQINTILILMHASKIKSRIRMVLIFDASKIKTTVEQTLLIQRG